MKVKIQKSVIEISNNSNAQHDLNVILLFETDLLSNGKKTIKPIDIPQLIDLTNSGALCYINVATQTTLLLSLGNLSKFNLENYLKAILNMNHL